MMAEHSASTPFLVRVLRFIKSARLRALMSLGMVLGLGAMGTLAVWSTSATATSGEFVTGSVDIKLDGNDGLQADTYKINFPVTPLLPGQSTAKLIPVQNRGTLPFNYGVTVVGSGALPAALSLSARSDATVNVGATSLTCTGGTAQNTVSPVPTSNATALVPNNSIGPLPANTGNTNLCVQVNLLSAAANNLQGVSTTLTLVFTATGVTGV